MRVIGTLNRGQGDEYTTDYEYLLEEARDHGSLHEMPDPVPARSVAPVRISSTLDNGAGVPRIDLHIALLARTEEQAKLAEGMKVVTPPLWKGKVHLHVIVSPELTTDDIVIAQAAADFGWGVMIDILQPQVSRGYPAGDDQ